MAAAECALCSRPLPDQAYACTTCAAGATRDLEAITDLAGPARDVAAGLVRRGPAVAGGTSGSRLPINLAATARLDACSARLTSWAVLVHGDRGTPLDGTPGPACPACEHETCASLRIEREPDQLVKAARWLQGQVEWLRHQRFADEAFGDIVVAVRALRGIADGPAPRRWLGQCGALTGDGPCRTDLNPPASAAVATCRTCGAQVVVADRRRELGELVRGYSYTAAEIAAAYPIKAGRIRQWALRKRILATGEVDGRSAYDLGEVLDLAAAEGARRAELEARRARRGENAGDQTDGEAA